ncbi:MAG: ABC transporter substrate-binding protein [Lachnospiraceae bacterium]|nr:ABC transporter substrate-binding protein [Lachnospiraceae bacterium]
MKKRSVQKIIASTLACIVAFGMCGCGSATSEEGAGTSSVAVESSNDESSQSVEETVMPTEEEKSEVTITDLAGREVTVSLPVENAYLGYYYENFLAVVGSDAFTRVKATSLYDTEGYANTLATIYKENVEGYNDMVDVGSTLQDNFDVEKLIELDCDVAIMGQYQYDAIADKVNLLEDAGIPVVIIDYSTATEETHIASTEILGKVFGVEERANEIIENYKNGMANVRDIVAKISDTKTTFHEFHSVISTYSEVGVSDFATYLFGSYLSQAGADDIAFPLAETVESGRSTTLDMEYILDKDPEAWFIIGGEAANDETDGVVMGYGVSEENLIASAKGLLSSRPGFENLSAVKNNQIYCVENNTLRTLRDYIVIEYIAKVLYPEEFADLDPEKEFEEYCEKYLPSVPMDGTFLYHLEVEDIQP